jgi:catechol 2,3-dioxygenase-like lactoylglutathione lyase family enzyme
MFDHIGILVSDRNASERFYDTVLAAIGIAKTHSHDDYAGWGEFLISQASSERPATRRLHTGFRAPSREAVDAFWRAGTSAGYRDDGAPALRPEYRDDYYGAFLLDPDGNSAEAVHHGGATPDGTVDHLWIRVADVAAARRFYETIAPHAGIQLRHDAPERVLFRGTTGSFSLVQATPEWPVTEHLHLAFGVDDDALVQSFHQNATGAGFADNGGPGLRTIYHPRYYAAFVLDPDGINVELVNQHSNRGVDEAPR